MIQVTPQMRVLVAVEPADFRRGIDGLAALCRQVLRAEAMSGTVFVFRNRRATSIKVLAYDGQGFWLCYKRLSKGRFRWWPKRSACTGRRCTATSLRAVTPHHGSVAPLPNRTGRDSFHRIGPAS